MSGQSSPAAGPHVAERAAPSASFARVVVPLVGIEILATLETIMAFIAVPSFMRAFAVDAVAAGWTASAYLLVGAASAAISGRLGDMFGRRRVLIVVLAISLVGSLVSLFAPVLWVLVAGRALQGCAAGALPLCFALVRELVPAQRVPMGISLVVGVVALVSGLGSLLGGVLIDLGGWRAIFVAASIAGVLAIVLVVLAVPRTPGMVPRPRIDVIGGVLLVPACAGVLLGASFGKDRGWDDPLVLGLLALGVAAFVIWVLWERRTAEPMVHLELFRHRKVVLTTLATIGVGVAMMGPTALLIPLVMQLPAAGEVGIGLAPTSAGLVMLASAFFGYAAAAGAGRLAQRYGGRPILVIAFALGILAALLWIWLHKSAPGTAVVASLNTMATAVAAAALPTLIVEVVPEANTGEATGMNRLTLNISVAIGLSLASLMLILFSSGAVSKGPTAEGLTGVLLLICAVEAVGIGLALAIGRRHRPEPVAEAIS
jgi:MFS family permease